MWTGVKHNFSSAQLHKPYYHFSSADFDELYVVEKLLIREVQISGFSRKSPTEDKQITALDAWKQKIFTQAYIMRF